MNTSSSRRAILAVTKLTPHKATDKIAIQAYLKDMALLTLEIIENRGIRNRGIRRREIKNAAKKA
tara:strand:- start:401 stop:595 length:195 start_codon:yes stop_codon:yes gene_type:complete